jgi:hypothetical protein
MDPDVVEGLSMRLLAFATRRARVLSWWLGEAGALAKGNTAQDVVLDALSQLYGGEHRWDPTRYPDPFAYLVLVVKTKLWNLAVSSENRLSERGVEDVALVEITTPETLLLEIEANAERRARASRVASALAAELKNDEELTSLHELMIEQGILKPNELAQRLGKPARYINNLKKQLARAWKRVATRLETERDNG